MVHVSFPTTVLKNRFDVLVIGIPNNLNTRKMTRESFQGEANSFEFSPCRTLGTHYRRPVLIKY